MLNAVIVGRVIQQFREKKKMSQELLSGLAGIGRTHLSAIERGERKPTLETFYRIGKAMEMRPSALLAAVEEAIEDEVQENKKTEWLSIRRQRLPAFGKFKLLQSRISAHTAALYILFCNPVVSCQVDIALQPFPEGQGLGVGDFALVQHQHVRFKPFLEGADLSEEAAAA